MTELLISVSHWTTPLNFDIAALTVTIDALTSTVLARTDTLTDATTLMPPLSRVTELPLLSTISTLPGPSCNVSFWPPGVSRIIFS